MSAWVLVPPMSHLSPVSRCQRYELPGCQDVLPNMGDLKTPFVLPLEASHATTLSLHQDSSRAYNPLGMA